MSKVINIFEYEIKRPSRNFNASRARFRATQNKKPSEDKSAWYKTLNFNIDYYNEHGKLPNNVDMSKVQGKGDAYKHRRG